MKDHCPRPIDMIQPEPPSKACHQPETLSVGQGENWCKTPAGSRGTSWLPSTFHIASLLAVLLFLTLPGIVEACPSCKEGLSNEHHDGLQEGFYWSILFMMSMPFLILGGLSTLFYLSIRKAKRMAEQAVVPTA